MRSLRLREANRAPANAGARLRLRAEVRRSRGAQAGLVVSVGIGAARLRRPQSVTSPATDCGLAPALCPPLRRIGLALEPPPLRRRPDLALELCLRDGVSASVWCRVPRDSVSTLLWGPRPLPWRRAPALYPHWGPRLSPWGHDPRSGVAPPVLGGFPAAMPRPTSPWGPRSSPGGCAMRKPSVLVAGGQNRRFFAVSEVRNGRFCRLFA